MDKLTCEHCTGGCTFDVVEVLVIDGLEVVGEPHDNCPSSLRVGCKTCDGIYWYGVCECGWHGTADKACGGGSMGDTGDFDEVRCPQCGIELETGDCPDCLKDIIKQGHYAHIFDNLKHNLDEGDCYKEEC